MEASGHLPEQYVFGGRDIVAVALVFSDEAECASCARTTRNAEAVRTSSEVVEETADSGDSASSRNGQKSRLSCDLRRRGE